MIFVVVVVVVVVVVDDGDFEGLDLGFLLVVTFFVFAASTLVVPPSLGYKLDDLLVVRMGG